MNGGRAGVITGTMVIYDRSYDVSYCALKDPSGNFYTLRFVSLNLVLGFLTSKKVPEHLNDFLRYDLWVDYITT